MNKNDLVSFVSTECGLTKNDATKATDSVLKAITTSLAKGQEVRLVGFGTFAISHRKASEGRNPRTGEKIKIAAAKLPKFRAGKALKEAVA